MRTLGRLLARNRLDLVAGLCDGILTALTLAAGKMAAVAAYIDIGLALRVACAAASSGAFMLFAAHYAQLRGELWEAEKQLNLTPHGRLADSQLGRAILLESAVGAVIGSAAGFGGAVVPLMVGAAAPGSGWLAIGVALVILAALGVYLARAVHGRPLRWAAALVLTGAALAELGIHLELI